jgi:hypothetical protein
MFDQQGSVPEGAPNARGLAFEEAGPLRIVVDDLDRSGERSQLSHCHFLELLVGHAASLRGPVWSTISLFAPLCGCRVCSSSSQQTTFFDRRFSGRSASSLYQGYGRGQSMAEERSPDEWCRALHTAERRYREALEMGRDDVPYRKQDRDAIRDAFHWAFRRVYGRAPRPQEYEGGILSVKPDE